MCLPDKEEKPMQDDYAAAYRKGRRVYQRAVLTGKYPYLISLEDLISNQRQLPEIPIGLHELPADLIVGTRTKGRQEAFTENFLPILDEESEFAMKWWKLYDAQLDEGIHDPVKVYEYMWKFYVEEGNKRVSVQKYLEVPQIMADVIRIMPEKRDEKEIRIYYEFVEFFQVMPFYEIRFSEEGCYARLAELLGQDLVTPWPEQLIEDVKYAFHRFEGSFLTKKGQDLGLTTGDAFLLYLEVFGLKGLTEEGNRQIEKRLTRIWDEFRVEARDDKIALEEEPGTEKKDSILSPLLRRGERYTEKNPLRIAFVYDKSPEESSWIYGHELGKNYIQDYYGGIVQCTSYHHCDTEEAFIRSVDKAVQDQGATVVFTTSPRLMPLTLRAAIHYPNLKFLNCSINLSHDAVRTYYGKMFEAKFLMGALAASVAENHQIGYVADYPLYGTVSNINAFAIGAAMVDPYASIHLDWSSVKSRDWHDTMRKAEVQVLSGPDFIKPSEASREYGLYRILEGGAIQNLAMPVWNWGKYYSLIVEKVLRDNWNGSTDGNQAVNYWWGMSSGVIDVILSNRLPYYSEKMIQAFRLSLLSGSVNPFAGELHSQEKMLYGRDNTGLTNEEIISMNWLNDNVIGSLPSLEDLDEAGQQAVKIGGVLR